jgi:hypothetical protein
MTTYPRMPRDFDFSLPDARARWISEAYGIPLPDVMRDIQGQEWYVDGATLYVTNRMFQASCLYYRQQFPEQCTNGHDPVIWGRHPDNPDAFKYEGGDTPSDFWTKTD